MMKNIKWRFGLKSLLLVVLTFCIVAGLIDCVFNPESKTARTVGFADELIVRIYFKREFRWYHIRSSTGKQFLQSLCDQCDRDFLPIGGPYGYEMNVYVFDKTGKLRQLIDIHPSFSVSAKTSLRLFGELVNQVEAAGVQFSDDQALGEELGNRYSQIKTNRLPLGLAITMYPCLSNAEE